MCKALNYFLGDMAEGQTMRIEAFFATVGAKFFLIMMAAGLASHGKRNRTGKKGMLYGLIYAIYLSL